MPLGSPAGIGEPEWEFVGRGRAAADPAARPAQVSVGEEVCNHVIGAIAHPAFLGSPTHSTVVSR